MEGGESECNDEDEKKTQQQGRQLNSVQQETSYDESHKVEVVGDSNIVTTRNILPKEYTKKISSYDQEKKRN